jgi:Ala-tRNA(Pro) deacylase
MSRLTAAHRVREHLISHGVGYEIHEHPETYTAQELAATEHVPGRRVAKPVILAADGSLVMAVLAAPDHVSLTKARQELGCEEVRIAGELEFGSVFSDCELGAEPPFGTLYGIPTYVDERLLAAEEILFSGGDHTHSIRISTTDYMEMSDAIRVDIAAGII